MSTPPKNFSLVIWLIALPCLIGGGGTWLFGHFDAVKLFQAPPPPRVSAAMVKGAWLNVVPREDASIALAMGRCLDEHTKPHPQSNESVLRKSAQVCEKEKLENVESHELAKRAAQRRYAATRAFWPDETVQSIKLYSTAQDITQSWTASAQSPEDFVVAKFLGECLHLGKSEHTSRSRLHVNAALCEHRSTLASGINPEARNRVVRGRVAATRGAWLGGGTQIMATPGPPTPANPPVQVSAVTKTQPIDATPIILDPKAAPTADQVKLAWMRTNNANEINAAIDLRNCLGRPTEGLDSMVMVCELRAMQKYDPSVIDVVIARRAREIPSIRSPGKRYYAGDHIAHSPSASPPAPPQVEPDEAPTEMVRLGNPQSEIHSTTTNDHQAAIQGLLAQWKQKATDEVSFKVYQRLAGCMKNTRYVTQDDRGLKLAADTCKLEVQVEMEREADAARSITQ